MPWDVILSVLLALLTLALLLVRRSLEGLRQDLRQGVLGFVLEADTEDEEEQP